MESGKITKATSVQFKRFDVVSDPSDHYYVKQSRKNKDCFTNVNGSIHRKIMKEWKILQNGLPESIYIRVYEDRIDMLQAVIVGAPGTPYHDGLFFFNIVFPSNYPQQPPKVQYRSHGLRLNPNLYANGYVCLSLINTWTGNKNETWDSSSSTILQVLVSIQGLVLNGRPYFNEPGHVEGKNKKTKYWINRSLAYNEDAFTLSCKTMLYVSRNPPKKFEAFVSAHFRKRADNILAAVKAYSDGDVIIGYYQHEGSSSSSEVSVSTNFKSNMNQLYKEIKEAFTPAPKITQLKKVNKKGARKMSGGIMPQLIVEKKPKKGILQKFIGVLKRIVE